MHAQMYPIRLNPLSTETSKSTRSGSRPRKKIMHEIVAVPKISPVHDQARIHPSNAFHLVIGPLFPGFISARARIVQIVATPVRGTIAARNPQVYSIQPGVPQLRPRRKMGALLLRLSSDVIFLSG